MLTRRHILRAMVAASLIRGTKLWAAAAPSIPASPAAWTHGLAIFGNLKYPQDFTRFDYVNADAPKGGVVRQAVIGTYDSFNMVVAGVRGDLVNGIELIYDTLMTPSLDEVSSEYGLLAEAALVPKDRSWVIFRLRENATWHDGRPVSPEDVIFSLESFRKLHPQFAAYYRHVVRAEKIGRREVRFQFDASGIRELPQVIGQLIVLPQHWWNGNAGRNIEQTTLEPPLGSGPYRIQTFEAGRAIAFERVADYWGNDLPANVGTANFDVLRFEYFRDPTVALEAFQAGDLDWREEDTAKNWATAYQFPAVTDRHVVLQEFPIRNIGTMQAFAFNTRRAKFNDPRVRRALNFAFDFETINRLLFYGQYTRITSYFDGTELASSGLPSGRELEFLEPVRSEVPPEVFTTPFWNPVSGSEKALRTNLLEAARLLSEAGFEVKDLVLIDPHSGAPMTIEFLISDQAFERVVLVYRSALERLGINVTVALVDDVQYVNRLRDWDFDVVVANWEEGLTPGNEQRDYWGSRAANEPGSRNLVGIENPAVDALIERIVFADNYDDLVAAAKALDRVLLWNHYVIPQWNFAKVRTARWDRFAHPTHLPKYGLSGFPLLWWWDAEGAARVAGKD